MFQLPGNRLPQSPPPRTLRSCFALLAAGLAAVVLAGCAGYELGPTNHQVSGARSVEIRPFLNSTIEPRLGESVTTALRKHIQKDGTYRLQTSGEADLVVSGTVTEFHRYGLSYRPEDVITPRDYWLSMVAHITARDRVTGKVVLDKNVAGRTSMRIGSDLSSAERQAVPLLADDLARNVTTLLADGTW